MKYLHKVLLINVFVIMCLHSAVAWHDDYCFEPPKMGMCKGRFLRYYYNPRTRDCEPFWYGGCLPNHNNFETYEKCSAACIIRHC